MGKADIAREEGTHVDEPVSAADPIMELRAMYLENAAQDIAALEENLGIARQDAAAWPKVSAEMRQITHNVKGQGTSFGYPLITKVGISLSRLLKVLTDNDEQGLKLVGAHVSALRIVLDQDIQGSGGELGEDLVGRLESLVGQRGA